MTDRNSTTPVEDEVAALSPFDEVKATIKSEHERLTRSLADLRKKRDGINGEIRATVAKVAEAERLVRALESKRRKT